MDSVDLVGLEDYENERFLDIGGRAYSRRFISRFSYTDPELSRPEVRVEYLRRAETFAGKLHARGLKPNFAYQLKLRGLFSNRESFERIGYLGRWRLPGRGTNYLDKAYEEFPDKKLVESYLLFDFVVTDPQGNAEKKFYVDSSLHVLWNATTQRKPYHGDTHPVRVSRRDSDRSLYANPRVDLSDQRIYAESEANCLALANRPPVGMAFPPPGHYEAEFVLLEESFHGYGDTGYWPAVMAGPVGFEVIEQARPPSQSWTDSAPVKVPLSLERAAAKDIDDLSRTAQSLEGVASSKEAAVEFAEEIGFPSGGRYMLGADIFASGTHAWSIFIDDGGGYDEEDPAYTVRSRGGRCRQRFEVEITSEVAGKTVRIRIVPAAGATGRVGVHDVGVYKIISP